MWWNHNKTDINIIVSAIIKYFVSHWNTSALPSQSICGISIPGKKKIKNKKSNFILTLFWKDYILGFLVGQLLHFYFSLLFFCIFPNKDFHVCTYAWRSCVRNSVHQRRVYFSLQEFWIASLDGLLFNGETKYI